MNKNQGTWLAAFVLGGLMLIGIVGWMNRGYGEISPVAYEYSKALYSACLNKSELHLSKVEQSLGNSNDESLTSNERIWLEAIFDEARDGNWQAAAKKARRMMEDQVQY